MSGWQKFVQFLKNPKIYGGHADVLTEADGFTVNGFEKVYFEDIRSVRYRNFPGDGAPFLKFEVLKNDGSVITINEEVNDVIPILNTTLEKFDERHNLYLLQSEPFGEYRWKQKGSEYQFITGTDERDYKISEFLEKPVGKRISKIAFIIFFILVLSMFALFYYWGEMR